MFPLYDDAQPTAATWKGGNEPGMQQPKKSSLRDEMDLLLSAREAVWLQNDVKKILKLLKDGEWAEHISTHPLIQELESEITKLMKQKS